MKEKLDFCLADQDSSIGVLSTKLRDTTKFKNLILKLGSKGVCVWAKKIVINISILIVLQKMY